MGNQTQESSNDYSMRTTYQSFDEDHQWCDDDLQCKIKGIVALMLLGAFGVTMASINFARGGDPAFTAILYTTGGVGFTVAGLFIAKEIYDYKKSRQPML